MVCTGLKFKINEKWFVTFKIQSFIHHSNFITILLIGTGILEILSIKSPRFTTITSSTNNEMERKKNQTIIENITSGNSAQGRQCTG